MSSKTAVAQVAVQRQRDVTNDIISGRLLGPLPSTVSTLVSSVGGFVEWDWDEATQVASYINSLGAIVNMPLTREYLRLVAEGRSTRGVAVSLMVQKGGITIVDLATKEGLAQPASCLLTPGFVLRVVFLVLCEKWA
jgi:hypothetical protein